MKNIIRISEVILLIILIHSCKKEDDNVIRDVDGNIYTSVTIGNQVWMVENQKTTKYNDGTSIPLVTVDAAWEALSTPGYCWYNNDNINKSTYGALYNWFVVDAASNGGKNVCPRGWHVPTDAEWTTLTTYLGGEDVAGGKLKETGTTHWLSPNTGATNERGFTALPSGYRYSNGAFFAIGYNGYWWSSTEYSATYVCFRGMYYYASNVYRDNFDKQYGFTVRCLRD
jgi:uncharacterized protein (TIGR02145 family)